MIQGKTTSIAGLALAALCALPAAVRAEPVEDFYRGKQIVMLVASGVGGGYDTYARAFARHVGAHIPGNPAIVPKNLPTAGGLAAANTLYSVSAKDGLTIAALTNGVAMDPLFGNPGARFDAVKFYWIGSIGKLQNICATWFASPIRTIEAARSREVSLASHNRSQAEKCGGRLVLVASIAANGEDFLVCRFSIRQVTLGGQNLSQPEERIS